MIILSNLPPPTAKPVALGGELEMLLLVKAVAMGVESTFPMPRHRHM